MDDTLKSRLLQAYVGFSAAAATGMLFYGFLCRRSAIREMKELAEADCDEWIESNRQATERDGQQRGPRYRVNRQTLEELHTRCIVLDVTKAKLECIERSLLQEYLFSWEDHLRCPSDVLHAANVYSMVSYSRRIAMRREFLPPEVAAGMDSFYSSYWWKNVASLARILSKSPYFLAGTVTASCLAVLGGGMGLKTTVLYEQVISAVLRDALRAGPGLSLREATQQFCCSIRANKASIFRAIAFSSVTKMSEFFGTYCWRFFSTMMRRRIRESLYNKIVTSDMGFFDKHNNEEFANSIMSMSSAQELEHTARRIVHLSSTTWKLSAKWYWIISQTQGVNLPLIVACASWGVVSYVKDKAMQIRNVRRQGRVLRRSNNVIVPFRTIVAEMPTIRSFSREKDLVSHHLDSLRRMEEGADQHATVSVIDIIFLWAERANQLFLTFCVASVGGQLGLPISGVYHFCGELLDSVEVYASLLRSNYFTERKIGAVVMAQILDRPASIETGEGYVCESVRGEVEFRDVSFAYPVREDRMILNGVSFIAKPGSMVGIVGQSGSGKSTLLWLVERFYDVTGGSLLIDGRDIREWNIAELRKKMSIVSQEPVLFECSILDNIRFGKPNATLEEVIACSKQAFAHDFILGLPEGYQTVIGRRNIKLSGGQKQRVAIARAMLMDPSILLLDEATSALDTESEGEVHSALLSLMHNRTTLCVAHRLSTVKDAAQIIVLKGGRCVESGCHDDLVALNGEYSALVKRQLIASPVKLADAEQILRTPQSERRRPVRSERAM